MTNKEHATLDYIKNALDNSGNPIAMCSFGKDSMVMLHLIRRVRKDIPIIFFKEPLYPRKYRFANDVIDKWNLTTYDFPPTKTDIIYKGNEIEISRFYNGFGEAILYVPIWLSKSDTWNGVCAIKDFLKRPTVSDYEFRWDTVFIGHKNNDKDPIWGETLLKQQTVHIKQMSLSLPLVDWTDADIWDYTVRYDVPYNDKRYDKNNGFKEFKDEEFNNDHNQCCCKCIDQNRENVVYCPLLNCEIPNVSTSEEINQERIDNIMYKANYVEPKEAVCQNISLK